MRVTQHPALSRYVTLEEKWKHVHKVTGKFSIEDWSEKDTKRLQRLLGKYPEKSLGSEHATVDKIFAVLFKKYRTTWNKLNYLTRIDTKPGYRVKLEGASQSRVCQVCGQYLVRAFVCPGCIHTKEGRALATKLRIDATRTSLFKATGVTNPSQLREVQEKKRRNQLNKTDGKYEYPSQRPEVREKLKQAWGSKTSDEIEKRTRKSRKTYYRKTGFEHNTHNPISRKKIERTSLKRYGFSNPASSPEIRKRINETWIRKYGHPEIFSSFEIQEKIKQHWLEENGTENPMGSPELLMKALRHKTHKVSLNGKKYKVGSSVEVSFLPKLLKKFPDACTQYDLKRYSNQYRWRPDFYVPSLKTFVEVKCVFTLLRGVGNTAFEVNVNKAKNSPNVRWVVEYRGKFLWLPEEWWKLNRREVSLLLAEKYYARRKQSFAEEIAEWLRSNDIDVRLHRNKISKDDIRVLCRNLIEHSTLKAKPAELLKEFQQLKSRGKRVVVLWEHEWLNRKTASKNYLLNLFGKFYHKAVGARKCEVLTTTFKCNPELKRFFNVYHLQGEPQAQTIYCLKFEGKVVAAMAFNRILSVRGNKAHKDEYELVRFASSCSVVGGASRLFKAFLKDHPNVVRMLSYSDTQHFDGGLYKILGFQGSKVDSTYKAVWSMIENEVRPKQSTRLAQLAKLDNFDSKLSEAENCRNLGIYRIYDCGLVRWVWTKT